MIEPMCLVLSDTTATYVDSVNKYPFLKQAVEALEDKHDCIICTFRISDELKKHVGWLLEAHRGLHVAGFYHRNLIDGAAQLDALLARDWAS